MRTFECKSIKDKLSPSLLVRIATSCVGLLFGFANGISAEAINGLKQTFQLNAVTTGIVVLSMPIGCLAGLYFADRISKKVGVRLTLILSAIFSVMVIWGSGSAINSFDFIASRVFGGAVITVANLTLLSYIANNTDCLAYADENLQKRSIIVGVFVACVIANVLSAFIGSSADTFLYLATWRWILLIELIPASIFLLSILLIVDQSEVDKEFSEKEANNVVTIELEIGELDNIRNCKSEDPKLEKIVNAMEIEQMYLVSRLNIEKFSKHIDIEAREVSLILNKRLQMNFFEFVNIYRVEEVKKRLSEKVNEKTSISTIIYDAGFNSTSSFHRFWNRFVGVSPTEFRKRSTSTIHKLPHVPKVNTMQAAVATQ